MKARILKPALFALLGIFLDMYYFDALMILVWEIATLILQTITRKQKSILYEGIKGQLFVQKDCLPNESRDTLMILLK